jgi:hypothetical protein
MGEREKDDLRMEPPDGDPPKAWTERYEEWCRRVERKINELAGTPLKPLPAKRVRVWLTEDQC